MSSKTVAGFLYRVLCGFFLGISIVAPGFSGSIIAITMGIYQDCLRIISNPFKDFKENVRYCLPLAIGAAASAVLFVLSFRYLFDAYPKATYLLFVGLIAGNLPMISAQMKKCGFKKRYLACGGCAFAAALALGIFAVGTGHARSGAGSDLGLYIWALGGVAGGVTMLIPGMSVTMTLIVVGVYGPLLEAAGELLRGNLAMLPQFALFCLCALGGLGLSSRGIRYILKKHPGTSNSAIMGFMAGALIGILISSMRLSDEGFNWVLGCVMIAAGLGISMMFAVFGGRLKAPEA